MRYLMVKSFRLFNKPLARGLNLSAEVAPWLLRHFHRDMPSLMSLLEALDAYSLETKRAITLPLVKEMLAQKN